MPKNLRHKIVLGGKLLIIFLLIMVLEMQSNNMVLNAQNSNLNKQVDLKSLAILDMSTIEEVKEEEVIENPKIESVMTGYVYNCPACSGKLACNSSIDLTNGQINYNDQTYGEVRIVASSKNLECGSIVAIKAEKLGSEDILAIVLDRGMIGNRLDLLMPSEEEAHTKIGRTPITYEILRNGY